MNFAARRLLFGQISKILNLAPILLLLAAPTFDADKKEILWNIISNCMETGGKDYCTKCVAPRADAGCNRPCRETFCR